MTGSIRALGVLEPILMTATEDGTEVILAGHRRAAAAIAAGLATVPVVIRTGLTADADQVAVMLAENVARDNLTVAEEAGAVQQMIDLGESLTKIASRTGLARKRVGQAAGVEEAGR